MVKFASYNIRKSIGTDRRRQPERIMKILAEVDAVEKMLKADFANCRLMTKEEVQKRHPIPRFISQAARLFSPIL